MAILDILKGNKDIKKETPKKVITKEETSSKTSPKKEVKEKSTKEICGGHIIKNMIIKKPHITEKAARNAENGAYTFEVHADANKIEVAKEVKAIYGVTPIRVNITNLPAKNVMIRGKRGVKSAKKKAVVYLKKGDKIEFV